MACEYPLEQVKLKASIWKKGVYESGEPRWKENYPPPTWGRFQQLAASSDQMMIYILVRMTLCSSLGVLSSGLQGVHFRFFTI